MKTAAAPTVSLRLDRFRRAALRDVLFLAAALVLCLLFAPPAQAVVHHTLIDDATGGDCTAIGAWNNITKTCTLNTDITIVDPGDVAIEIVDNDITLDGNGHVITGPGPSFPPPHPGVWVAEYAVRLESVSGVEVRNLAVDKMDEGIIINGGGANTIQNNVLTEVTRGIVPALGSGNQVTGNNCDNAIWTCVDVVASNLNEVTGNTLTKAGAWGLRLFEGHENTIADNTISNLGSGYEGVGIGIWIFYADNNQISGNTLEGFNQGMFTSEGSGNTFSGNLFLANTIQAEDNGLNSFNLAAPGGGNLWDDFDEPAEGCFDVDIDGWCDAPYVFTGNQDDRPVAGMPALSLGLVSVYWESMAMYVNRILNVDYVIDNVGAVDAFDVRVLGSVNTNGVTDAAALPLYPGDVAVGNSAPFTLTYNIPMGVMSFGTTVYSTGENEVGVLYEYPGTFPGP